MLLPTSPDTGEEEGGQADPRAQGAKLATKANLWFRVKGWPQECQSLSAALAREYLLRRNRSALRSAAREGACQPSSDIPYPSHAPPRLLRWAVRWSECRQPPSGQVEEFLINYSPLERLPGISTIDDRDVKKNPALFENKVVLLGRAQASQSDSFGVPGRHGSAPGVKVHACAIYTLIQGPIYELTPSGRGALDFVVWFCPVAWITWRRWPLYHTQRRTAPDHLLHQNIMLSVALAVLLVSIGVAQIFRLMWDDSIFVIGGVLVHPFLEHMLGSASTRIPGGRRRIATKTSAPDQTGPGPV